VAQKNLQRRLKRERARLKEVRAELAKLKRIEQVEWQSIETLGNPHLGRGRVGRARSGRPAKAKQRPPRGQGATRVGAPPDRVTVRQALRWENFERDKLVTPEERAKEEASDRTWARRAVRQDLGREASPADFETPAPPEDFVRNHREFLSDLTYIADVRAQVRRAEYGEG